MLGLLLLVQTTVASAPDSGAGIQGVAVEGKGSPTAAIPRIEADEVRVDGVLDEPVWNRATRLTGFWQYQPVDGRPAEEQTEVLVWYAPDAIWFGVIAHDKVPGAIRATVADRDNIDNEDHVVIDIDTFHDRRRAFSFAVNPLGAQSDGVRSEGAGQVSSLVPGSTDLNPDFTWESKGRVTGDGYQVEIRIPFKSLRYPSGDQQSWGLNVTRVVQRTGYTDTWTDARRANASFLGQEGAIGGLHDLKRGVAVEAQPFVTATANGTHDDVTNSFDRESVNPDAGLNFRLGFTSYSLDATINPDFSQVETDAGQVTLNERFALFYPEKRPFFLEGIELFGSPQTLVYTRRIVDPKARRQAHRQVRPVRGRPPHGGGRDGRRGRRLVQHHPAPAGLRAQLDRRRDLHQPRPGRQPQPRARGRLPLRLGPLLHPVPVRRVVHQQRRGRPSPHPSGRWSSTGPGASGASTIY